MRRATRLGRHLNIELIWLFRRSPDLPSRKQVPRVLGRLVDIMSSYNADGSRFIPSRMWRHIENEAVSTLYYDALCPATEKCDAAHCCIWSNTSLAIMSNLMYYCPTPTPFLVERTLKNIRGAWSRDRTECLFDEKQCIRHANMMYYTQKQQRHEHIFYLNNFRNLDNGRNHGVSKNNENNTNSYYGYQHYWLLSSDLYLGWRYADFWTI